MDHGLEWLLDPAEPAVRALALVDLAGRAPDDPDVQAARKEIAVHGASSSASPRDRDAFRPRSLND